MELQGKKILLGITGSIAAYKMPMLIRLFTQQGAEVKVVATKGALQFVTPIVLNTLSNNVAVTELTSESQWNNHVHLGRWADVFLIAPLSCNTLSKMATGLCDNAFMAVYLSATCPIIAAPAMDEDMWLHPTTKANLNLLKSHGVTVLNPETGSLASGLIGQGRMPQVETLYQTVYNFFNQNLPLKGKHVLITAGPTHQPIDPVRFIGNRSSGKMGVAITQACMQAGALVTLVYGPGSAIPPNNLHQLIKVQTAAQMYDACMANFSKANIAIMCAAVADYTPATVANQKIKKADTTLTLKLQKTEDILATLGNKKKKNQLLVGFALETNNEEAFAISKLNKKNADIIIMNSTQDAGATFATDTNKVTIFSKSQPALPLALDNKSTIANHIVNFIINYNKK